MHSIRARLAPKTGDNLRGYPAIYHRLLRFLKRLEKDGYLVSEKGVFALGMDEKPCYWWRPTHAGLYLIRQVQKSNLCKLPHDPDILEGDTIPRQTTRPEFQTRYPHEDPAVPAEEIPGWVRFPKRSSLTRLKAASSSARSATPTTPKQSNASSSGSIPAAQTPRPANPSPSSTPNCRQN